MRRAAALLALAAAAVPAPSAAAQASPQAVLVLGAPGISFEEAALDPQLRAAAASGGLGLMTTRADDARDAVRTVLSGGGEAGLLGEAAEEAGLHVARVSSPVATPPQADLLIVGPGPLDLEGLLGGMDGENLLLIVVFPSPSASMRDRGDVVTPLVVGRGSPGEILQGGGAVAGLTSDTTRRRGLVSNVDVAPTLLAHLGIPVPREMTGSPIEVEGEPPAGLHARFLEVRSLRLPLQVAVLALGLAVLVAVALFLRLRPLAPELARALGVWTLVIVVIPIALLPVGLLPRVTWLTAMSSTALLTAAIAAGAWTVGARDATAAVALVGAAGLALLAVDGAWGFRAMIMPVIGGGALDGARFHGIGNVYAGVLLAGAVLVAAHLRPWSGVGLLASAALLAGLPGLGSNLGAATTLFAATGLWMVTRLRRRLGTVEVLMAAAVAAAGAALVVLAHRFLVPDVSHIARAAEETGGGGLPALLEMVGRRLAINFELTSRVPVAWLVVVALAGTAWMAARRLGHLARDPEWRDACLVLSLSALVGFVVNDTGIGLAGLAFVFVAAALAYPALEEAWTRR